MDELFATYHRILFIGPTHGWSIFNKQEWLS
jgi:hypothetical protein